MMRDVPEWDYFVAHASPDLADAEALARVLRQKSSVFYDGLLPAGVRWDDVIPDHLTGAAVIVALISPHLRDAHYLRDEIAIAIQLERDLPRRHRIVPVYLDRGGWLPRPYGLTTATEIRMPPSLSWDDVAARLNRTLRDLRSPVTGPNETAAEAVRLVSRLDLVARGVRTTDEAALARHLEKMLHVAVVAAAAGDALDAERTLHRLRVLGLPPRALIRDLPGHPAAARDWNGTPIASGGAALDGILERLAASLASSFLAWPPDGIGPEVAGFVAELIGGTAPDPPPLVYESARASVNRLLPSDATEGRALVFLDEDDFPGVGELGGSPADLPADLRRAALRELAFSTTRLPARDPFLTGRDELIEAARTAVAEVRHRTGRAVAFFSGQPGVGTSTVAVEVARVLDAGFTGGVHYLDLHGLDDEQIRSPRTTARILAEALRIELPTTADDAAYFGAFRDALAQRAVLLVLDNARDGRHVSWLGGELPGTCGLIVTSRNRVQAYAHPTLVWHVEPLDRPDSISLIRSLTGDRATDPPALDRLAALVGDLPLALRLIGARLASRPDRSPGYLAQLLAEELTRLDYLAVDERAVRAAIQLSYALLDERSRTVLRLMPVVPGLSTTAPEFAHGLRDVEARVELDLNRLVDLSMAGATIADRPAPVATFVLPELIRLFARERLTAEVAADAVDDFARQCAGYLRDALKKSVASDDVYRLDFELDAAKPMAALTVATAKGWDDIAIDLSADLHVVFGIQKDLAAMDRIHASMVGLYVRNGRMTDAARAYMRYASELAKTYGRPERAQEILRAAAEMAKSYGDVQLAATALLQASVALGKREDWAPALRIGEEAALLLLAAGKRRAAVPAVLNCCSLASLVPDQEARMRWATEAVALTANHSRADRQSMAQWELGGAQAAARQYQNALGSFEAAAALDAEAGAHPDAAVAAASAASMAANLGRDADCIRLSELSARHWEEAHEAPLLAAQLVNLSAAYLKAGKKRQAAATLARADRVAGGIEQEELRTFRYELGVRRRVFRFVHPDAAREWAPVEVGEPDSSAVQAELLSDLSRRAAEPPRSRWSTRRARAEALGLLTRPLFNHPPAGRLSFYEDLDDEDTSTELTGATPA